MSSQTAPPNRPIVLDLGTGFIKAGFAGEPGPRFVVESLIPKLLSSPKGHILCGKTTIELTAITSVPPRIDHQDHNGRINHHHGTDSSHSTTSHSNTSPSTQSTDSILSSHEHRQWIPNLRGSLPMKPTGGDPLTWTAFDILAIMLHSIFKERLRVRLDAMPPVIVVQSALTPQSYTHKLTAMLFETHRLSHLSMASQPVMSLYAMRRESGIVIDSGYDSTTISPVLRGRVLSDAVCTLKVGGRHLTEYMMRLTVPADHQNPYRTLSQTKARIRELKEQYGFASTNFEQELLQKGSKHDFVSLAFQCPEPLFQPHLVGISSAGIHELIYHSLSRCDASVREELMAGLVLSGGSSLFDGLGQRLENELQHVLFGQHLVDRFLDDIYRSEGDGKVEGKGGGRVHIAYGDVVDVIYKYGGVAMYEKICDHWTWMKVAAPSDRQYSAWVGTAQHAMEGMASMDGMDRMERASRTSGNGHGPRWVNREQYTEHGPAILTEGR